MLVKYMLNNDKSHLHTLKLSESNALELLSLYKDLRALQFRVDLKNIEPHFNYYNTVRNRMDSALLPPNNLITKQLKIYKLIVAGNYEKYADFEYNYGYRLIMKLLKSIFIHNLLHLHVWNVHNPQNFNDFRTSLSLLYDEQVQMRDNHTLYIIRNNSLWMLLNTNNWKLQHITTGFLGEHKARWTYVSVYTYELNPDTRLVLRFCQRMKNAHKVINLKNSL